LKTSPNFSIEYFCDKNALKKPSKMSANMEKWSKEDHEVAGDYSETLNELKDNSRPQIQCLTELARDYGKDGLGHVIVEIIKIRHMNCRDQYKFPTLYLVDSILKNHPNPYKNLFSKDRLISDMFVHLFQREKEKGREKLFKLRSTWTPLLANDLLLELDHAVKRIDKAWPITAKQSTGNTVFVNPNFIPKDKKADKKKESSKVESDQSEDEEDEETKRLKEQMKELKRKKKEIEKAKMLKEIEEMKRQVAKDARDLEIGATKMAIESTSSSTKVC